MLLSRNSSQLFVIDVQERLVPAIAGPERVIDRCKLLIAAAKELAIPIVVSEQYPKGLGPTVAPLREALGNEARIMQKIHFSCAADTTIMTVLDKSRQAGRPQIVICGMESHVCVAQTALDLKTRGFDVFVVADAVSSRTEESCSLALDRFRQAGIGIVNAEMAVFEWLGQAGTPEFKVLSKLIK